MLGKIYNITCIILWFHGDNQRTTTTKQVEFWTHAIKLTYKLCMKYILGFKIINIRKIPMFCLYSWKI
jgi:hypothetical protein